ncbi:hypothetical protein [Archangium sp.]|uniref:hypothetical protein n=1 Tax=Archangium sp. TaxID=1872627 RepID=UPI00286A8C59|nr:hypothetical protein [Archangium sp.]
MRVQRMLVPLSLALMGLSGCNVYDRWDGGEFNAGPVDASNFPPEYLGGGNRLRAGSGSITARASVSPTGPSYFLFSLSTTQRAAADQLLVRSNGKAVASAPTPSAFLFDGCKAPEGYSYDATRDDVPYDQQGAIFTALPVASYSLGATPTSSYVPLVQRVPVTSNGVDCQKYKSEKTVVASTELGVSLTDPVNNKRFGISDGTLHALAIIEPGVAVYRAGETSKTSTGVGPQKWGWFNQYQLAYIDGGGVPTVEGTATVAGATVPVLRMKTQKLYYPRSAVTGVTAAITAGQGYDVLQARRGEANYSPVCELITYDAGGPLAKSALPKTEAEVLELAAQAGTQLRAPATGDKYVYCLQVE